jgi:hypothetical protein
VVSVVAATAPLISSSTVMFAAMEHLVSTSVLWSLHLKLGALHLHRYLRLVHLRWLEKLVRL